MVPGHERGQAGEKYRATFPRLPPGTEPVVIRGGTHMNYGRYLPTSPEDAARARASRLPVDEQHRQVAAATVELLHNLASVPR